MYVYMILGYVVYMDMHTIWLNHVHVRKYYYVHVHIIYDILQAYLVEDDV